MEFLFECSIRSLARYRVIIGDNMISIAIWCFFKDNKIAPARRASATCSFRKIYKCLFALGLYLHQIVREILLFLARAICNLYSCYDFALVLQLCTCVS